MLSFASFRLDLDSERLWKKDQEVRLRRKPFAILRFLTQNPKRLVTHAEVVDAVWGKVAMSESLLRTHMHDLRSVLGEGVVETVVGRGYRFVAEIQHVYAEDPSVPAPPVRDDATQPIVGRDSELDALGKALRAARDRKRTTIFITGEAGVGKTTLVDRFLEDPSVGKTALIGRGACVEQYGSGQAYLPVLDAIAALCRGPSAARAVNTFAQHAPTWLVQMPTLVRADRLAELQRRVGGASQGRSLRELAEALDTLSIETPVILALDDLQWTDPSTAGPIALLGGRREPARLLLLGTYRTSEVPRGHPLTRVTSELGARRQASLLALEGLSGDAVEAYVSRRYPRHRFPAALAATVQKSTGGNPLFVTTLMDDLEAKQLVVERDGSWELATTVEDVAARRPDGIRRLIDTQIDRLPTFEQRIVETAAVAGIAFTAGAVAHALDADVDAVDSACESLANERRFLRYDGTETWADGTIQSRYSFGHSLFQHAALTRSTSANVRALHRKLAERIEAGHASCCDDVAAELAVHFDRAQAPAKAAHYHVLAAERAGRRHGLLEAIGHYERACALLATLPPSKERDLVEMRAKLALGWRTFQRDGSTGAALPMLERARELAVTLDAREALGEAVLRLETVSLVRGDTKKACEHAREAAPLLEQMPETLRNHGKELEAVTVLIRGDLHEALSMLDAQGVFRGIEEPVSASADGTHVMAMAYGSFALWLAGRSGEAVALVQRGHRVAEVIDDPWEQAALLSDWATLHALRGEPAKAKELATRSLTLAEHGAFGVWKHRAALVLRWADANLSPDAARADEILSEPWESVAFGRTLPTLLFATTCARLNREEKALGVIADALAVLAQSEERWLEAELHRLRGEILAPRDGAEAERSVALAVDIARRQGAASLELRANLSLHRMVSAAKKRRVAEEIGRILGLILGGDDSPDVVEARRIVGR